MKKNCRKKLYFIILFFFFFFYPLLVGAEGKATTGVRIEGKPYLDETFDVVLYINDVSGTTNDEGLAAFGGHFYYDTDKLELVEYQSLGPFNVKVVGNNVGGFGLDYITGYQDVLKFTFRALKLGDAIIDYPDNDQPDSKANPVNIAGCQKIVSITNRPIPLTIDQTDLFILTGKSKKLTASYHLEGEVTGVWTSLNPFIASVDQFGNVTGNSPGVTTIIYQTSNGYQVECEVTISDYLKGDVNQDGKITIKDVMEVIYFYIKKKVPTESSYIIGDMNEDGKLNLKDANLILAIYMKK